MRVFYEDGIVVQDGIKESIMDPARPTPGSIVSHGHMDHLTEGGVMTPETLEILKVRKHSSVATPLPYNLERDVTGLRVRPRDAGHVFGSAMIRADDLLYTGDMNPEGGVTCGKAVPERCTTLVIEATYGKPYLNFPPKHVVESDLLNWVEFSLSEGPVAVGGYDFGKAQELIALVNRLDRKSTRLNSSHITTSYAVFCLKKKNNQHRKTHWRRLTCHPHSKLTSQLFF